MKSNIRLIRIAQYLEYKPITSYKEISDDLGLSERSTRYEIENLNYYLDLLDLPIIKKDTNGTLISNVENYQRVYEGIKSIYKMSRSERQEYLMYKLLLEGNLNITREMKLLDVSRNTIRADLKVIIEELEDESITVSDRSVIDTAEDVIRLFILNRFKDYYSILFDNLVDVLIESNIEKTIRHDFEQVNVELVVQFANSLNTVTKNQIYDDTFLTYLLIAIQRIKRGQFIEAKYKGYLSETKEYQRLELVICDLETSLGILFSENERLRLVDIQIGYSDNTYNPDFIENMVESKLFVTRLIRNVSSEIGIPLEKDGILVEGLFQHTKSTIYRVKNGFLIQNDIYFNAVNHYQDLYRVVDKHISEFEEMMNFSLPKEEIALFVVHFLGAIRRYEEANHGNIKILLLCNAGYGTSVLLRNLIEKNYFVEVIDTVSLYQLSDYNLNDINMIVSTIDLGFEVKNSFAIPIVFISPFLSFDDDKVLSDFGVIRKKNSEAIDIDLLLPIIEQYATITDRGALVDALKYQMEPVNAQKKEPDMRSLFDTLSEANVTIYDNLDRWETSIKIGGKQLISEGVIEQNYLDEIFRIIDNFGPYFVIKNNIALPHADSGKGVIKSGMHVTYIKSGVAYPESHSIKLVFIIASEDKSILLNTVMMINELAHNKNLYDFLETVQDEKGLINYFKKI